MYVLRSKKVNKEGQVKEVVGGIGLDHIRDPGPSQLEENPYCIMHSKKL